MTEDVRARQLGTGHDEALEGFENALRQWALPFLQLWMNSGGQPVLSSEEIEQIRSELGSWESTREIPQGYEWLPGLLWRLVENKRFNRRNLVNIHPSPLVPSVLASTLVALQNPNNIVPDVSKPTWELEELCVKWMAQELFGFDPDASWGNVVSGGTVANMTALMVARDYSYRKLARPRPAGVRERGLFGRPAGVVLATAGSHYSIKKALWFLGIGDENVVRIPVAFDEVVAIRKMRDKQFVDGIANDKWETVISESALLDEARGTEEMAKFYAGSAKPFALQPLDSELFKALYACFEYSTPLLAYVFTIGTTETGTIESPNLKALDRFVKEDIFIHADAASGGFALQHPGVRELVKGLERVHSVAIDGHKFGHLAYPNGAVVFRDRGWMFEILHEAPYLRNLAPTLEGSRPGSHVAALWAAIEDLGKSGRQAEWLDRIFAFVKALVSELDASGLFQVLHEVHLSTVSFAPKVKASETRSDINRVVAKMEEMIRTDTSKEAFLINRDDELAGIKVRNSNRPPRDVGVALKDDPLVDVCCLRLVATNPAVEASDAGAVVAYLAEKLERARSEIG